MSDKTEPSDGADVRERIHISMPAGATADLWGRALECARYFATAYMDKPTGRRNGTEYLYTNGPGFAVWWTRTRAVSVRLVRERP